MPGGRPVHAPPAGPVWAPACLAASLPAAEAEVPARPDRVAESVARLSLMLAAAVPALCAGVVGSAGGLPFLRRTPASAGSCSFFWRCSRFGAAGCLAGRAGCGAGAGACFAGLIMSASAGRGRGWGQRAVEYRPRAGRRIHAQWVHLRRKLRPVHTTAVASCSSWPGTLLTNAGSRAAAGDHIRLVLGLFAARHQLLATGASLARAPHSLAGKEVLGALGNERLHRT